ncbi:hypothetical protein KI387_005766, partial [Taxus chinensis]
AAPKQKKRNMEGSNTEANSGDMKEKGRPKRKAVIWKALVKAGNACGKSFVFSPLKLVCRARNTYVRTLLQCKYGQETAVELPISFNCTTNKSGSRREEENLRRLIKMTEIKLKLQLNAETEVAAVAEETSGGVIMSAAPHSLESLMRSSSVGGSYGGRHRSSGIAPIDEESPCYFPGSFKKRWATPLPRTTSCGTTLTVTTS